MRMWYPYWINNIHKGLVNDSLNENDRKRIYISRKKANYRKVVNEDDILPLLEAYNVQTYCLEDLSVWEQMELFRHAELIISPHGSGLANICFCGEDVRILEIYSQWYQDSSFRILSHVLGYDYNYTISKTDSIENVIPQNEDMVVDVEVIARYLMNSFGPIADCRDTMKKTNHHRAYGGLPEAGKKCVRLWSKG